MKLNYLDLGPPREAILPRSVIVYRSVRAWWRTHKESMGIVFAEALFLHLILFVVLAISQSSSFAGKKPGSNLEVIRQAIAELSKNPQNPGFSESAKDKIDSFANALDGAVKFDDGVDKAQKVEIAKYMIQSIARMRAKLGGTFINVENYSTDEISALIEQSDAFRLNSGEKTFHAPRGEARADGTREIEFYTLDRAREARIRRLRQSGESERESGSLFSDLVRGKSSNYNRYGVRSIPAEVYFRDCPYEQIMARGATLFSVIKGFPALGTLPRPKVLPSSNVGAGERSVSGVANGLITLLIIHPTRLGGSEASGAAKTTTGFSAEGMDRILDNLMTMPEGKQFIEFERAYLRRFDPNSEDLVRLVQKFVASNLNGVFYWTDDFSMAFDILEELFYKRPIYDALAAYVRQHPRTKTAAEFLFILADAYDFERRALVIMDTVYEDAGEMLSNLSRRTNAYNYKVKAYVLHEMADEVRARLRSEGFRTVAEAARRYRDESVALYRMLESLSGEIANRARFALGQLYWEDGATQQAMFVWQTIDPAYSSKAFQLIRPYLDRKGDALSEIVSRIGGTLSNEANEGNAPLLRRQLKFHKWTIRANALK